MKNLGFKMLELWSFDEIWFQTKNLPKKEWISKHKSDFMWPLMTFPVIFPFVKNAFIILELIESLNKMVHKWKGWKKTRIHGPIFCEK